MARYHTDCVERPLRICFETMGAFIGSHPWWFLIAPLILSTGLGSGFYFLNDRMSNNIEEQFTPVDGRAKMERKYIQDTFPGNDSMFSSLRMNTDGNYATLIATSDGNILSAESLQDILDLDIRIRRMVVRFDNRSFEYVDVCAEVMGSCTSNDVLDIIEYNVTNVDIVNLTFPWYQTDRRRIPLHLSLGSVKVNKDVVESAKAVQLHYYLREDDRTKTDLWLDNVRTKVWVACCGVLSTGLAVLSGFGALLLLGQPFVMTVASCPFMILGIGLDDMFIMISCWQRTRVLDSVPARLSDTYRDATVSISITTLTDALALFLGYSSPFGSVQSFCLYAGVSVCFCYLYSITFLGACMALNGRREANNKHWFTCARIPEDLPATQSKSFSMCCVGGSYDRITEKEEREAMGQLFERFYGPFLTHKWIKACVFVIYVGYLAVSIYGCFTLKKGLDRSNLALDDSYLSNYYNTQRQHFSEYGCTVMVAVKQLYPYWSDSDEREHLFSCVSKFENLSYVNGTFGWFLSFQQYADATDLSIESRETFQTHLRHFLKLNPMFRQDINRTADNQIQASRFFIQTLNTTTMEDMMGGLRETAEECPVELMVYHPAFIYFDQYSVITSNTIQTILVVVIVMLVVSLILIPSPLCSVWVAFAICSVIVGVTGFMSLWGVHLDSISMINLVMCIGFSVDFSAHISYSFVSSPKSDVNEKAMDALARLGYPIVQGALSTVLGVVVLSVSRSYIFRSFFKIVFLVIIFGLLHGLVFIPVFLTIFGACWKWC
ncbi:hypothetical protein PAMA_005374 [Pampus argenteus]